MGNFLYKSKSKEEFIIEDEGKELFSLTRNSIEGRNILVIGKKGKGKTTLIIDILTKLSFRCGHIIHSEAGLDPIYQQIKTTKKIYKKFDTDLMSDLLYDTIRFSKESKYFVIDSTYKNKGNDYNNTMLKLTKDNNYTILMTAEKMDESLRNKFDLIFVFKDTDAVYVNSIWKENKTYSSEQFRDYVKSLNNEHTCLVIDKKNESTSVLHSLGQSWEYIQKE